MVGTMAKAKSKPKAKGKPVKATGKPAKANGKPAKANGKPTKATAKPAKAKGKPAKAKAAKGKPAKGKPAPRRPAKPAVETHAATGRAWGPESHFTRALELHRDGKLALARAEYERAIAEEDGGTFPKLQLLRVLDALEDVPAVLALVDELQGRGQNGRGKVVHSPVISACEARARLAEEDFPAAEAAARTAVALDQNDVEAWRLVAVACAAQDNAQAALEPAERVTVLAPKWATGHFMRALYLHRAGRTAEAAVAVERSTQLEPNDGDAWFTLACYRALLGDKREALAALTEAIRIDRSNAAIARSDGDLVSLANDARFKKLTAA